jgi:hypothetical protein
MVVVGLVVSLVIMVPFYFQFLIKANNTVNN